MKAAILIAALLATSTAHAYEVCFINGKLVYSNNKVVCQGYPKGKTAKALYKQYIAQRKQ